MYARNFLDEVFTLNKGSWKEGKEGESERQGQARKTNQSNSQCRSPQR